MPPQRTDLVLTTDIPHGEGDVLVLDSLDVKALISNMSVLRLILTHGTGGRAVLGARSGVGASTRLTDGGDSGDDFAELELVENGGLSGSIQTHHENSHLLLGEIQEFCNPQTHLCGFVGSRRRLK